MYDFEITPEQRLAIEKKQHEERLERRLETLEKAKKNKGPGRVYLNTKMKWCLKKDLDQDMIDEEIDLIINGGKDN